jgi:large subunit ribosomal protein L3
MGNKQKSVLNLRVVKVDSEKNLLFIKGAIPGARNSYVEIYQS